MKTTKIITQGTDGTWDLENIIGAPCMIKSERCAIRDIPWELLSDQHTIETVKYRVLTDGKLIPLFKLKGVESIYFTADNLIIEGIVQRV